MTAKAKLAGNTLIYGHRKQDDLKWDIGTPELRAKAFLELFNILKKDWEADPQLRSLVETWKPAIK